jgi:hypothetical protein
MAIRETKPDNRPGALRVLGGTGARHTDVDAEATAADRRYDPAADRLAYSVAEAALLTDLSCDLLYDQMRTGRLAFLRRNPVDDPYWRTYRDPCSSSARPACSADSCGMPSSRKECACSAAGGGVLPGLDGGDGVAQLVPEELDQPQVRRPRAAWCSSAWRTRAGWPTSSARLQCGSATARSVSTRTPCLSTARWSGWMAP